MKRLLTLAAAIAFTFTLMSCASDPPVVEHHHHYRSAPRTTTTTTKSASVSGSSSPEAFQAVSPPSSYSQ